MLLSISKIKVLYPKEKSRNRNNLIEFLIEKGVLRRKGSDTNTILGYHNDVKGIAGEFLSKAELVLE
jgi:hypothetical protein